MSFFQPPSGDLVQPTISNPVAGANFSFNIPSGQVIRPRTLMFRFVTDANVASRTVTLYVYGAGGGLYSILTQVTQAASLTYDYSYVPSIYPAHTITHGIILAGWPADLWLESPMVISSQIYNIQATDQLSSIHLLYERFIRH